MPDFDWVKERAKCSLDVMFRHLAAAAARDVESINELLADARARTNCAISVLSDRFIVTRGGPGFPTREVVFRLGAREIAVESCEGKKFVATPALSRDHECRFVVSGVELELWQVCQMAFEELFFDVR